MHLKFAIALLVVVLVTNSEATGCLCNLFIPHVNGGLLSTACIVLRLCTRHSDSIAQQFNACYDQAPGKQQFLECQREAFGNELKTDATVVGACRNLPGLIRYARCLGPKFTAAGVNQADAVTKVNKCQGGLLGLNV